MVNNTRTNKKRSNRGTRRNRRIPNKAISSTLRGNTFRVNPDPTSTVDRPWNSVVLSFSTAAAGTIPVTTVRDAFRTQVGAGTTTPAMEFRFLQFRAWELSGQNLAVQIFDLDNGTQPHRTQHDEPGRNHWATVGLQWSVSQQMNTFDDSSQTLIATIQSNATTINALVHLHIMWRFMGAPAPTNLATLIPLFKHCAISAPNVSEQPKLEASNQQTLVDEHTEANSV